MMLKSNVFRKFAYLFEVEWKMKKKKRGCGRQKLHHLRQLYTYTQCYINLQVQLNSQEMSWMHAFHNSG